VNVFAVLCAAYSVLLPFTWLAECCTCGSYGRQKVSTRYQTTASGETLVLCRRSVYCTSCLYHVYSLVLHVNVLKQWELVNDCVLQVLHLR